MPNNTKYDPETVPQLVFDMILKMYTDKEIYTYLGITHTTFYDWCKTKPELSASVRAAKKVRAQKILPKLKKRAEGFHFTEVTQAPLYDNDGNPILDPDTGKPKIAVVKKVKKYIPPDVAALKFYITNQDPDWKERHTTELEVSEDTGVVLIKGKMSIEEWKKRQEEK